MRTTVFIQTNKGGNWNNADAGITKAVAKAIEMARHSDQSGNLYVDFTYDTGKMLNGKHYIVEIKKDWQSYCITDRDTGNMYPLIVSQIE